MNSRRERSLCNAQARDEIEDGRRVKWLHFYLQIGDFEHAEELLVFPEEVLEFERAKKQTRLSLSPDTKALGI